MITYKDIKLAINKKLIDQFNVEVNSKDITEGFNRPSFFVEFDNMLRSSTEEQVEKEFTVRIYYFPEDRHDYSMELLQVQEDLETLFDLKLEVKDRRFNIIEATSDVVDGVLTFNFDIHYLDGKEVKEVEPMENLEF